MKRKQEKRKQEKKSKGTAAYHPRRPRRSVKLDRIHPADLAKYELRFFCDDCSHFDSVNRTCTLGYRAIHTKTEQMSLYHLTGQMALCRFLEID